MHVIRMNQTPPHTVPARHWWWHAQAHVRLVVACDSQTQASPHIHHLHARLAAPLFLQEADKELFVSQFRELKVIQYYGDVRRQLQALRTQGAAQLVRVEREMLIKVGGGGVGGGVCGGWHLRARQGVASSFYTSGHTEGDRLPQQAATSVQPHPDRSPARTHNSPTTIPTGADGSWWPSDDGHLVSSGDDGSCWEQSCR